MLDPGSAEEHQPYVVFFSNERLADLLRRKVRKNKIILSESAEGRKAKFV